MVQEMDVHRLVNIIDSIRYDGYQVQTSTFPYRVVGLDVPLRQL